MRDQRETPSWREAVELALDLRPPASEVLATLMYGSRAREDHTARSDFDVFLVMEASTANHEVVTDHGTVYFSVYSDQQVDQLFSDDSLFAVHIGTEGVVMDDRSGVLQRRLGPYRTPASFPRQAGFLADLLSHLDARLGDVNDDLQVEIAFRKLGSYLLRSSLILHHQEVLGRPCFDWAHLYEVFTGSGVTPGTLDRDPSLSEISGVCHAMLANLSFNVESPQIDVRRIFERLSRGEKISFIKVYATYDPDVE